MVCRSEELKMAHAVDGAPFQRIDCCGKFVQVDALDRVASRVHAFNAKCLCRECANDRPLRTLFDVGADRRRLFGPAAQNLVTRHYFEDIDDGILLVSPVATTAQTETAGPEPGCSNCS
jgi:hypothetical protein